MRYHQSMTEQRLSITGSFHSEGAKEMKRDVDDLSDSFSRFAEEVKGSDEAAYRIFQRRAQQSQEQAVYAANLNDYKGSTYTGIAGRAIGVNDFNNADLALGMAHQSGENTNLVKQRYAELHKAELRYAKVRPGEEGYVDRSDASMLERAQVLERHTRTGIAGGSKEFAQQNMERAEAYLEQLRLTGKNTDAVEDLTESMKEHRKSIEGMKNTPPGQNEGVDVEGAATKLGQYAMQRGLGGAGELGNIAGMLTKFLGPGGLIAAGVTATAGAGYMALRGLDRMDDQASTESLEFVNLGRMMNTGRSVGNDFMQGNFETRHELAALHYTAGDAKDFLQQYDGVVGDDVANDERGSELYGVALSGLRLARMTGSSPDNMANLYSIGARTGALDANDPEKFASVLFAATRDGLAAGISQSDTFKNMENYLQRMDAKGVNVTTEQLATYGEMLYEEAGAGISGRGKYSDQLIDGLANPKTAGTKMLMMTALGFGTEKGLPTYQDLGLEWGLGGIGDEYEALAPIQQGDYLMELFEKRDPRIMKLVGDNFSGMEGLGTRGDISLQVVFGKSLGMGSTEQMLQAINGTGSVTNILSQSGDYVDDYMNEPVEDPQLVNQDDDGVGEIGLKEEKNQYTSDEAERITSYSATVADATTIMTNFNEALAEGASILSEVVRDYKGEELNPELQERRTLDRLEQQRLETSPYEKKLMDSMKLYGGFDQMELSNADLETTAGTLAMMGATSVTTMPSGHYWHEDGTRYSELGDGTHGNAFDLVIGKSGQPDPIYNPFPKNLSVRDKGKNDDYGNYADYQIDDDTWFRLGHLESLNGVPDIGKEVEPRMMLGIEGRSGKADGYHTHFELHDPELEKNPSFEEISKLLLQMPSPTAVPQPTGEPTSSLPTQKLVVEFMGEGIRFHGDTEHPFSQVVQTAMALAQAQFKTSSLAEWQGSNRRGGG